MTLMHLRFLPRYCLLCDARAKHLDLCEACYRDLPWLDECCPVCALPQPRSTACADCQRSSPPFSAVFAPLRYEFPVDAMINRFKHRQQLADGELLASVMSAKLKTLLAPIRQEDNLIVPVPLHPARLRQRGFNQAALLATSLAQDLALPVSTSFCRRIRTGNPAQQQSVSARKSLVSGAFEVLGNPRDRRILLVDDVVTTCATVREISRCLLGAGAADVVVMAAARTPSNAL